MLLLTRFRLRQQVTDSRLATRTDSRSDFAASQSSQMSAGPGDPPEICQSPSTASLHATCPDDILVIRIPRQLAGHGSRPSRSPSRIWFGGGSWGLINHINSSPGNNKIKIISAPKARPHRAAGAHEAHIGPDRALRRVNDAFIRVPTAEYTRAVHLSVLPLNSATEGAEFKFVLRTARQVERMSVAQDRREG